jgi:hypothetical protein
MYLCSSSFTYGIYAVLYTSHGPTLSVAPRCSVTRRDHRKVPIYLCYLVLYLVLPVSGIRCPGSVALTFVKLFTHASYIMLSYVLKY